MYAQDVPVLGKYMDGCGRSEENEGVWRDMGGCNLCASIEQGPRLKFKST